MTSQLLEGTVFHRRLAPADHVFRYHVHFVAIDLDDLEVSHKALKLFSYNTRGVLSLRDADYLDAGPGSLREKFYKQLESRNTKKQLDRVVLVTSCRTFGYAFNPVSFFLGFDKDDELLCAVVEVNNTFGDRHVYALTELAPEPTHPRAWTATAAKDFHVSPFNDLHGEYRFQFVLGAKGLGISVDLYKGGQLIMETKLSGKAFALTDASLARVLLRHPLRAVLTMPRIMKQAFVLKTRKGLSVFRRPEPVSANTIITRSPSRFERFAMSVLLKRLQRMQGKGLCLTLPDGRNVVCGDDPNAPVIRINTYRFFTRVLRGGSVAFGECYTEGDIHCDDLPKVLARLIEQRDHLHDGRSLLARLAHIKNCVIHFARRNTKTQSRHNIHAHYDLSNDFFATWLDSSMTYSAALYRSIDEPLESAQRNKINALIDLARIGEQDHVLEIGTGWGSFAIQAASRTGCRVTTVTISEEQFALARQRVSDAGLSHRIDVQFKDYRDLTGRFDRIVSVEMIEAVGHRYLPTFFETCNKLLAEDGLLVMQAITIPDHRYAAYRKGCDWIQKYIFPGGHLPSLAALQSAMGRKTPFYVEHLRNIGLHYARTLRDWTDAFDAREDRIRAQGFDDAFIRKWRYYMGYCEAGFGTGHLNTMHLVISRPNNRALMESATNPHRFVRDEQAPAGDSDRAVRGLPVVEAALR